MTREYSLEVVDLPKAPIEEVNPTQHKTLRLGRLSDVDDIMRMARSLTKGGPIDIVGHSDKKTRQSIEAAMTADGSEWLILVSHVDDKPVGVLIAYSIVPLFSENKIAYEVLMYLEPEHRKGRRGLDLMKGFEYWAKLVGCKVAHYGWLSNSPPELKTLYTRLGCVKSEEIYFKEL